jgi:hypothetical protein
MRTKLTITEPRNSRRKTTALVRQLLLDRLKKLGSIRLKDAWEICKEHIVSISVLQPIFKQIMMQMVADGKADIIRPGIYWIYRI